MADKLEEDRACSLPTFMLPLQTFWQQFLMHQNTINFAALVHALLCKPIWPSVLWKRKVFLLYVYFHCSPTQMINLFTLTPSNSVLSGINGHIYGQGFQLYIFSNKLNLSLAYNLLKGLRFSVFSLCLLSFPYHKGDQKYTHNIKACVL